MMDTPIYNFAKEYAASNMVRGHTPGHKGKMILGCEYLDITEIAGADALYNANGIIKESEKNASLLFGTQGTFYSAQGSSLCVRAMLFLARMRVSKSAGRPVILAGRNAHSSFVQAAALLDFDIKWLWPEEEEFSLCSCPISPEGLKQEIKRLKASPAAVFITSPDYLGGIVDIAALSRVCRDADIPLMVDNAHGAYLRFLPTSLHPMDLGADICCDSAHKTLPVLTGGAYLHVSAGAPKIFIENARRALHTFGSTSPSYLILESLDLVNYDLANGFSRRLGICTKEIECLKKKLCEHGWAVMPSDPLRITVKCTNNGYTGEELAELLRKEGIESEYAQAEHLVLLLSTEIYCDDIAAIQKAFTKLILKEKIPTLKYTLSQPRVRLSVREALLSPFETIPAEASVGRILAAPDVSCPPAVPIIVGGEEISPDIIALFHRYGIKKVDVCAKEE